MGLLTFNEDAGKWTKTPHSTSHEDAEVEFQNNGKHMCHIRFNPIESLGLDYLGLEPGYRIRLPILRHTETTCTAFVAQEAEFAAGAAVGSTRDPKDPVPDPLGTARLDSTQSSQIIF